MDALLELTEVVVVVVKVETTSAATMKMRRERVDRRELAEDCDVHEGTGEQRKKTVLCVLTDQQANSQTKQETHKKHARKEGPTLGVQKVKDANVKERTKLISRM